MCVRRIAACAIAFLVPELALGAPVLEHSPLLIGLPAEFQVHGAAPGADVVFLWTPSGPTPAPCPPFGVCIDLLPPVSVLGADVSDSAGFAEIKLIVPPGIAPGTSMTAQALVAWESGLATTNVTSDVFQHDPDLDGDGFGASVDCDDGDATAYPGAPMLCDGIDNDCDGMLPADDRDLDGDGWLQCDGDCDDADPSVYPGAPELCDGIDNDCDAVVPIDELDGDGDGTRSCDGDCDDADPTTYPLAPELCDGIDNNCNDAEDEVLPRWYLDADLDGFGAPDVAVEACEPPDGYAASDTDCDDDDDDVFPGAWDLCDDGIDQDCDGIDQGCRRASCRKWLQADPGTPSGVYPIQPMYGGPEYDVYCDMDTDGGGWTLVASTRNQPPADLVTDYHPDLTTLSPAEFHAGVWGSMRQVVIDTGDVRFACRASATGESLTVDVSVYDVDWYREITSGSDAASCFSENQGTGYDTPAPARRDNLTGVLLPVGDDWDAGYLEGEDACDDAEDFTIDFDDRGMDSDASDGTDWGMDDGRTKCGRIDAGEAWFLFVREP